VSIARKDGAESPEPSALRNRDLVHAYLGGDDSAFDEIVQWYYPALFNHARRLLRDERLAEDAVQDAFLRAYRALPAFAGEYQLGAWLHRILVNVCLTEGARRGREADANQRWAALAADTVRTPEDHAEHAEAVARVTSAIALLPASYREALVLRDVLDLDYADVADRSGISEDNARARVSRARAALRRMVEPSVVIGGFVIRGWRRGTRWAPRAYNYVSSSANAVSEAVNMPARATAITAVATTSVAAVAVAVPLLSTGPALAPKSAPVQVTAGQPVGPASTAGSAGTVIPAAAALASSTTSSTSSTSTTSSTTIPSTSSTTSTSVPSQRVVAIGGATPTTVAAPTTRAVLTAEVPADTDGGLSEESAELVVTGSAPVEGDAVTRFVLPDAGPLCSGKLSLTFNWADGSGTRGQQITVNAAFVSEDTSGETTYDLEGTADVVGGVDGLAGPVEVSGTFSVPTGGSADDLSLEMTSAQISPVPACVASPASSTTLPTTTLGG
jgi:RNA polymerase sigma-70 factor (ECF subfamily)